MLIYLYLFSLVVGGVLLGASILLGGDHGETDAGDVGDTDFGDADGDLGDVDHGDVGDAEAGHGEVRAQGEHAPQGTGVDVDILWMVKSTRFWTFFLAFFGLTGVAMDGLGLLGPWPVTLAASVAMGLVTGVGAATIIRKLANDDSAAAATSSDYVGKSARVLLPVAKGSVGKVRLRVKGTTVDVLATTDEERPFDVSEEALVVEMDGTRARVARLD